MQYFSFFESYYKGISAVKDPQDRLALYDAVFAFAFDDKEPELEGIPAAMFELMRPNLETSKRRSDAGSIIKTETKEKQNENKRKSKSNQNEIKSKSNANQNANNKEKEKEKGEGEKKRVGRFAPPSLDEVREYCAERQNKVDPEAFVAFYESNGWKVGKNSMKCWKAAVRTWEQRDKREQPRVRSGTPGRFGFKEQRKYDMEQLERQLLAKGARA